VNLRMDHYCTHTHTPNKRALLAAEKTVKTPRGASQCFAVSTRAPRRRAAHSHTGLVLAT